MQVQFNGDADDREHVNEVSVTDDGGVVLRHATGTDYVEPDEFLTFMVTGDRR